MEQGWEALKTWGQAAALAPSLEDMSTEKVIYATTMCKDNVSKHVALSSFLYGGERCILWLARFYEAKNVWSVHRKSCQKWGPVSLMFGCGRLAELMNSQRYWARDEHENKWAQIPGRFGHVRNSGGVFLTQGSWCEANCSGNN